MDLLAILGRGIQQETTNGPWVLTEDLEVLGDDGGHAPFRLPVDDQNPNCLVGGGELNLLAGLELCHRYRPKMVVCAYGHRSSYLQKINGPTESEVMSEMFHRGCCGRHAKRELLLPRKVEVWPSSHDLPGPSNTYYEIQNILAFANGRYASIGIVTVSVHLPRSILFTRAHLRDLRLALSVDFYASEEVLVSCDTFQYAMRVLQLFSSEAFRRNAEREARGTKFFLEGGVKAYAAGR